MANRCGRALAVLVLTLCSTALAQSFGNKGAPKAKVDLLPSVERIVPLQPFEVAVRFQIDKGWHIYWQNPGDAGVAPKVKWTLPTGFSVGDLQFPVPAKHVAPGNIITYILEDEVLLLVNLTPPAALPENKATLTGEVRYLVCKESCLQESAKVSLDMPVGISGEAVKPANEKPFESARKALPSRVSKYAAIQPVDPPTTFAPAQKFELTLAIDVSPGFHIQSHKPLNENFIATDLLMEKSDGFTLDTPKFPEGKLRPMKVLGQISEYSGRVLIKVPVQGPDTPPVGPVRFGGLLYYQACNEQGNCFPPDILAFSFLAGEQRTDAQGAIAPAAVKTVVATTAAEASPPATPASATIATAPPATTAAFEIDASDSEAGSAGAPTLLGWLLAAFLGGLILNIMPCVLPVISIKVLSLVQQANEEPGRIVRLGMTFVAGIVVSFLVLAVVIIALKSTGQKLGWGFQFQSPVFVLVMSSLIFLFGLSLFGVFEITLPGKAVDQLAAAESHEGYTGAFMKGVLGTVLATPCTAPFLGTAMGWALTVASGFELFLVFMTAGVGMASPFIILSLKPQWLRFLPRPGKWMEHFKQFMGFLLMGTVIWLLFPLGQMIGPRGLILSLIFLTFLGVAAWLVGKQTVLTPPDRRFMGWIAALAIVAGGWWTAFGRQQSSFPHLAAEYQRLLGGVCDVRLPGKVDFDDHIPWQPWKKGLAEQLALQGYTVYVDYTAAWCATCLANKHATLESGEVRSKMGDLCVVPVKADFTSENPEILAELGRFGRAGVPTNVIFPAGKPNKPILLPEQLVGRASLVISKLEKAGPSQRCGQVATSF